MKFDVSFSASDSKFSAGFDNFSVLQGKDGETPYIKDGYWWIGDTNTNVKAEGTDGKDGKDGINGTNGKDGINGADGKDGIDGKDGTSVTVVSVKDGEKGSQGAQGLQGEKGEQGIKGDKGDTGAQGIQGIQGEKGEKGDTGATGASGKDGVNGKDGVPVTHSWNGTTLTVTSASGTSSADLKGEKGAQGIQGERGLQGEQGIQGERGLQGEQGIQGEKGATGKDGISASHSWNGTVLTITSANGTSSADLKGPKGDQGIQGIQGEKGADGAKGADGYTPVKGTDYFTEADKAELINLIKSSLSLGIASDGLIYLFVDGVPVGMGIPQGQSGDVFGYVDENNTIVLNGNLADGTYSVKYEMDNGKTVDIGNMVLDSAVEIEPTNFFVIGGDGYLLHGRTGSDGGDRSGVDQNAGGCLSNYFEIKNGDTIYVTNATVKTNLSSGVKYTDNTVGPYIPSTSDLVTNYSESNGITQFTINSATVAYTRLCLAIDQRTASTAVTAEEIENANIIINIKRNGEWL